MWPSAPHHPTLATFLLTTLLAAGVVWGECQLEDCNEAYLDGMASGVNEGATPAYCALLHRYVSCTQPLESSCRGEITYHSSLRWLNSVEARYNCSHLLAENPAVLPAPGIDQAPTPTQDVCQYEGSDTPAHCGLFGDPHLKTFGGDYMTCGVGGAWPLLNTPHLAIQVTNEPVSLASDATATTKVTVIVKSHEVCGPERTYEASSEALPRAFVDGTTWAGGTALRPHTQVREESPGHHVLITVSYINAIVAVRKIGKYLTVLVKVPESVLEGPAVEEQEGGDGGGREEMQLCLQGCPAYERLNTITSRWRMDKREAVKYCKEYNVTDYYLDSCIFDLVTTGDKTFREAALAAQKDLWEHDPAGAQKLLQNCSQPPCIWDVSSTASPRPSKVAMILVAAMVLGLSRQAVR